MWKNQIQELNNMSNNKKCVINIAWRYKTTSTIDVIKCYKKREFVDRPQSNQNFSDNCQLFSAPPGYDQIYLVILRGNTTREKHGKFETKI